MQKIELELDDQTLKQARQLAELRHTTLEEWLSVMIEQLVTGWSATTSTSWEKEKAFIQQPIAKGPLPDSGGRSWRREDIVFGVNY